MKNNAVIKRENMLSSSIASLPQNNIRANAATPPTANNQIQPHSIKNSVCIKLRYRRNRGGICGKTYGTGFDIFSCCNRQFEKSSVALFIIPSSEIFACAAPLCIILNISCQGPFRAVRMIWGGSPGPPETRFLIISGLRRSRLPGSLRLRHGDRRRSRLPGLRRRNLRRHGCRRNRRRVRSRLRPWSRFRNRRPG